MLSYPMIRLPVFDSIGTSAGSHRSMCMYDRQICLTCKMLKLGKLSVKHSEYHGNNRINQCQICISLRYFHFFCFSFRVCYLKHTQNISTS